MRSDGCFAVAGQQLEYAHWGDARTSPTLVLLHEGLGCVAMWKDFPATLAARTGLNVLAYSRTGYGQSSAVALPRPLDFHHREALDILPRVLDLAGCGDCVLIGHSDGASIALIHAGAVADPRVRGVAALAPHILAESRCISTIRAAIAAYEHGDLRAKLLRYHGANVDGAFRGWSDTWVDAGFATWSIEPCLDHIDVPLLLIRGDDDPYNTPIHVARIAALARGPIDNVALHNCGHAPHVDQAGTVLDCLAAWLTRCGICAA